MLRAWTPRKARSKSLQIIPKFLAGFEGSVEGSEPQNQSQAALGDNQAQLSSFFGSVNRAAGEASLWRDYGSLAGPGNSARIDLRHRFSQQWTVRGFSSSPEKSKSDQQTAADPVWNWPNGISMARLISGPAIAYLIWDCQWGWALSSLAVSGATDWLDGFIARRYNQGSVLGSYLDPLADKVLICSVTGALAMQGSLYAPLAWLIIGRDVFLVAGAFVLRFRALDWRWPGWSEFFRTTNGPPVLSPSPEQEKADREADESSGAQIGGSGAVTEAAPFVTPLYISKVNTVVQMCLIGSSITSSWYGWPSEAALLTLGGATGLLTCASGYEYYRTRQKL